MPRSCCATSQLLNIMDDRYRRNLVGITDTMRLRRMRGDHYRTTVRVVPVVVHIVGTEDVLDAVQPIQIDEQFTRLNVDFRATNPDRASVPDPFQPLIADVGIRFEVTDIRHVESPRRSFTIHNDAVKFVGLDGSSAVEPERNANLWVCNLERSILGYAQFPGGPAESDGVVIHYQAFGSSGSARTPFNLGRTATHEFGHYFGLYHIWGNAGVSCRDSDDVGDTPNQLQPNSGTPAFPTVSCNNGPHGDLFCNYMDYVDDAAMTMFTHGQSERIHAVLAGLRKSIGHDETSEPVPPPPDTPAPADTCCCCCCRKSA